MAENNRPRGRKRNVTGQGTGVNVWGEGHGGGPVGGAAGKGSGSAGSGGSGSSGGRRSSGGQRNGRGMGGLPLIVVLLIALLGGGGTLGGLFGGGSGGSYSSTGNNWNVDENYTPSSGDSSFNFAGSSYGGNGSYSTGWTGENSSQTQLDSSVASGSRDKFTTIKGNGDDTVTIMVYLCGTDLESRSGMGTSDLQEMAAANLGKKINLLVYTGGCSSWRNNIVSSKVNQIYQVLDGGVKCHVKDAGNAAMTNPDTLAGFIQWCAEKYPANRYELILWDHGGGSVSGYGYDEKNRNSGSMTLSGIQTALQKGGVKFDFIGFDACLMATTETALMLDDFADYMVASEETEPGVGWYYTDWLNALGKNTSMPTVEVGQRIVDSFVDTCARKCQGQKTTLSVVDLAEVSNTIPDKFSKFSKAVKGAIADKNYQQIAQARSQSREFAASTKIDQVDLVHLAENTGLSEGKELASVIRGAVKYNRTSANMTNAHGLSIYFPYRGSAKYVDSMSKTYQAIGMDADYTTCIRQFASLQVSGQAAGGGSGTPYNTLFGDYGGQFTGLDEGETSELISTLLSGFLSGDYDSVYGMSSSGASFLSDRALSDEEMTDYLQKHHFDATQLGWVKEDGKEKIKLSAEQWNLVTGLVYGAFYDTGNGYAELGYDSVFEFDEEGNLIADSGNTWISINNQPVPYIQTDVVDDGTSYTITGRVPCLLNGQRSNLILVFDNENENGYVAGAASDYTEDGIDVQAKIDTELQQGDVIQPVCDMYSYDGTYQDNYNMGKPFTIENSAADLVISDTILGKGKMLLTYKFTDIYGANYWTQTIQR